VFVPVSQNHVCRTHKLNSSAQLVSMSSRFLGARSSGLGFRVSWHSVKWPSGFWVLALGWEGCGVEPPWSNIKPRRKFSEQKSQEMI
jgi:hypothetical protein